MGPRTARSSGVAFIYPNPKRGRTGTWSSWRAWGPLGTWRSMSLPDMLPDYVVYDAGVAAARGSLILGPATVRGGGFFTNDWKVAAAGEAR